jgi:hypothetical protein
MSSDTFVLDSRVYHTAPHSRSLPMRVDSGDHRQLDLRLSGAGRCNLDVAAELIYVAAILARSSA